MPYLCGGKTPKAYYDRKGRRPREQVARERSVGYRIRQCGDNRMR